MRRLPLLLPLLVLTLLLLPSERAEANFFSVYAQGHGTLLTGGGSDFFEERDAMLVGGGAELGAQLLFLHAFMDLNYFGKTQGQRLYWNQIGLGPSFGLPLPGDRLSLAIRGHLMYVNGTFESADDDGSFRGGGVGVRAGGDVAFRVLPMTHVGAAAYAGYHFFVGDRGGSGGHGMGQLFLRFKFGI